ncbi:hypothetical protein KCU90_g132, partial [Aureobasidium melanogenum]
MSDEPRHDPQDLYNLTSLSVLMRCTTGTELGGSDPNCRFGMSRQFSSFACESSSLSSFLASVAVGAGTDLETGISCSAGATSFKTILSRATRSVNLILSHSTMTGMSRKWASIATAAVPTRDIFEGVRGSSSHEISDRNTSIGKSSYQVSALKQGSRVDYNDLETVLLLRIFAQAVAAIAVSATVMRSRMKVLEPTNGIAHGNRDGTVRLEVVDLRGEVMRCEMAGEGSVVWCLVVKDGL